MQMRATKLSKSERSMVDAAWIQPLVWTLGCALFLAAGPGCSRETAASKTAAKKDEETRSAVLVNPSDVVPVSARRLEAGVSFSGELTPQDVTEVIAHFDGDLQRVLVREGQRVRKGQSLAVYKPIDVNDAWNSAQAGLLSARAGLAAAVNAEKRAKRLLEAGAAAPSDVEAAEAARAAAEAVVKAAEGATNHAREDRERLDVPSPIGGWVSKVVVHNGDRTAVGDRLLTVVNTDTLELAASIPSEALGEVRIGTPIRLQVDAFPGAEITGKVDRINPTTEAGTRQVKVYTRIPNEDGRLVGGLYVGGRIVFNIRENASAAPVGVIRKEGAEQVVYRLRQGRAGRIPVQTGLLDEATGFVELLGAVEVGDSLLTGLLPGLRDGVPVRLLAGSAVPAPASPAQPSK
jgi:membrane fusion protein, multidrug efflux system